ncbi:hypothetical protein ACGFYY_38260 [Streptomyces sp. NPDC048331]|uniref:hypothetical protein n=1 Tax=Streptomyces sp. NPDC048331 TaxID=3365534 RepID=UPI003717C40F
MSRAERIARLGPEYVAYIRQRVAEAPAPDAAHVDELRPILTNPAKRRTRPAGSAPAAA